MRIVKSNKFIKASNETGDSDIPTYKLAQQILDCDDWEEFGFSCEEECNWCKKKAKKLLDERDRVNACGDVKASKKVCGTSDKALTKDQVKDLWDKKALFIDFGDSDAMCQDNGYTLEQVLEYMDQGYEVFVDSDVKACGDVKASKNRSANDQALQHIKAAIDILGKSGNKDDVTKDSIANLGVVMFDLKSKK